MFKQWPVWISRNRSIRRSAIKVWRVLLRVQRATFAKAVLVVHGRDGRILVLRAPSGKLQLPVIHLDGWLPIPSQVETWLERLSQPTTASLVAIEGTPAKGGVTFLYAAMVDLAVAKTDEQIWLEPDIAASGLDGYDKRLLIRCS
jgi:hypothetical protein